jgi:cold shock CspA family protein
MALHLMHGERPDIDAVADHLRRSYSAGDRNFEARYDLAQLLFLQGNLDGCRNLFEEIDKSAPPQFRRMTPRSDNVFTKRLASYEGTITALRESFAFIRSVAYLNDIFGHRSLSDPDIFDELGVGEEVNFKLRFNREGPTAVAIRCGRASLTE